MALDRRAATRHERRREDEALSDNVLEFGDFTLDVEHRRLERDGAPVEVSARYFDALVLMVREPGGLVTKDRFHEEVWRGIPVTDEALTQCVRSLRRALGDDASNPRFIETVPKHGYRFVATVTPGGKAQEPVRPSAARSSGVPDIREMTVAATLGGAAAGIVGGLVYGFASLPGPGASGGALSGLLVMLALNVGVGLLAGAAIGLGIALIPRVGGAVSPWVAGGAAAGGMAGGALAKMLGLDAFRLLLGETPGDITGAAEGALMGLAVGSAYWLATGIASRRKRAALVALVGAAGGLAITLCGGVMMGGSLALLADNVAGSQLSFARLTALFGEDGFGFATRIGTSLLEGTVCALGIVGAMQAWAHERRKG